MKKNYSNKLVQKKKEELKKNNLDYSKFEQITNECQLQVQCGDCGNVVPNPKFIPREGRPYYCNKCLPKHKRRPYQIL